MPKFGKIWGALGMAIKVYPVKDKKDKKKFIKLPWKIYRNDPNWVPPLIMDQKKLFDRAHYPFFEHSEGEFFLAERDGEVVGRIAAHKNNIHLDVYQDDTGFFGFFESVNDPAVAQALFTRAQDWLRERGLKHMRGPENYTQNEEVGLLVDGFDSPPKVMMTYNPDYYISLYENFGLTKKMDLYAYYIGGAHTIPERLQRHVDVLQRRYKFTVRPVNKKKIDREVAKIMAIYNNAWSENWGAVPLTKSELEHIKEQLLQILIPDLALIAEIDNETVGISITLPDINEALIKLNGRLLPFGIFKLLWYKNKIKSVRVLIMGVLKGHRHKGIDTVFYHDTFKNGMKRGFHQGEMSWILENNYPMRNAMEKIYGAKIYKTYRLYEKPIT